VGTMVSVRGLEKRYGDIVAVRGISFDIAEGEVFSLLGPNGAGKTTTISMLSCLVRPTAGDATVAGHSVTKEPLAVKASIGVVPQEIALYESLSARENLRFWGSMYGMTGADLRRRVDEVLELMGLADRAGDRVSTYSGGMKRRINIAVGLLHRPRLLFLDEPTVGIDPQSRRNILDLVKALNREGMTVLYTTHYMQEAQELSHRVGIMDRGELIALGTQAELTETVGQHDTLRLHVAEGQPVAPLAQALQGQPWVLQASERDSEVVVLVASAEEALAPAVSQAEKLGIRIRSVDIEEPNLETVFLHLTGRALRD
jgi:ABC-2 type transport system ATP-binding protein